MRRRALTYPGRNESFVARSTRPEWIVLVGPDEVPSRAYPPGSEDDRQYRRQVRRQNRQNQQKFKQLVPQARARHVGGTRQLRRPHDAALRMSR